VGKIVNQLTYKELYNLAEKYENKYGTEETINKFFILAIIYTESEGINVQDLDRYALGLMQISDIALKEVNRVYKRDFKREDLLIPSKNVECGVLLLKHYYNYWYERIYNKVESLNLALLSYSWGITNVINWISRTRPSNNYIDEKIPEEKRYYNESIMFWYYYSLAKYEQEILSDTK
jgi:soluble lytic murein transglycosylase-like protein